MGSVCQIHCVTEVDTKMLKKLINNFCYIESINNKAENEHQMACILWCVCVCVCVCVLQLKYEDPVGHCLETCHFLSDSAACGQAR